MMRQSICLLFLCVSTVLSFHFDLSADRKVLNESENARLQGQCGHYRARSSRVFKSIYGALTQIREVPWVVSFVHTKFWYPNMSETVREKHQTLSCSGSLISPRHVLTAAHCFGHNKADCKRMRLKKTARNHLDRIRVYLGGSCSDPAKCKYLRRDEELLSRTVVRAYIPSNFTGGQCSECRGDIAVLELDKDVPFSKKINPICIPKYKQLHKSKNFRTSGFGTDAGQNNKYMPTIGVLKTVEEMEKKCVAPMDNGTFRRGYFMGTDAFCTEAAYMSPCTGDSGGGVIQSLPGNNLKPFLAGVVRAGLPCRALHQEYNEGQMFVQQSIMTDVKWHLGWICRVTGVCPDGRSKHVDSETVLEEVVEMRQLPRDEMYAT